MNPMPTRLTQQEDSQPGLAGTTRVAKDGKAGLPVNQRKRQKAETRLRLLEAATEVFQEEPPTTASLEEIAARAGVRRQTLLYHFENREGLMNQVLAYHLDSFQRQFHDMAGGLRSRLYEYLHAYRHPLVRMVRHLGALTPTSPKAGSWYPIVAGELEQDLIEGGVDAMDARGRSEVIALALLHMADHVATDRASDADIDAFVHNACKLALTPTASA